MVFGGILTRCTDAHKPEAWYSSSFGQAKREMNKAKAGETAMNTQLIKKKIEDIDVDNYYTGMAAKKGKLSAVEMD